MRAPIMVIQGRFCEHVKSQLASQNFSCWDQPSLLIPGALQIASCDPKRRRVDNCGRLVGLQQSSVERHAAGLKAFGGTTRCHLCLPSHLRQKYFWRYRIYGGTVPKAEGFIALKRMACYGRSRSSCWCWLLLAGFLTGSRPRPITMKMEISTFSSDSGSDISNVDAL